jgi:exodeoxyribonuclease VIII
MTALSLNPRTTEDFNLLAEAGLLTGIFPGIDGDDYHRKLPGISKTSIELAALTPANMIARRARGADEDSEALLLGKMLHSRIEHHKNIEKYKSLFVLMPTFSGEGMRKAKADWLEANKDSTIINAAQAEEIEEMFAGLMANPQSKAIIEADGHYEDTIFWIDPESGVLCKCRPDKRIPLFLGGPMTDDWKSIRGDHFSKKGISDAIYEHSYHVSAAFTIDGMKAVDIDPGPYVFVFVQKKAPNKVLCVPAREIDIDIGRRHYKRILMQIAECQKTGVYPGFIDLGLPDWFVQREMALG